jgi:hypothetical protein
MDVSNNICFLQGFSLRRSHRYWLGFLKRIFGSAAAGSSERKFASLELLSSRGLVLQGIDKKNVDGESVMVQAGADGWQASDIAAAAAAGADINATGINDAAEFGNAISLAALLSAGGNFKRNFAHCYAVYNAALNGHAECVKLLLDAGGDVNKCTKDGVSPIFVAAQNGHAECLKLLLDAGGDVNKCHNDGASFPIYTAAFNCHAECLKLLLAAGGDVNKCTKDGVSPIVIAAQNGHAECLKLLLDAGGDVNKCMKNGVSPIFIAAEKGHAECVKLLLDGGGDVNKGNNNGVSPIYIAAMNGRADCLKLLLAAGADPRSNFKGTFALDIARQKQHAECARLLEAALT